MMNKLVLQSKGSVGSSSENSLNRFIKEVLPGIKSSKLDLKEFFTDIPEILDSTASYSTNGFLWIRIYLPLGEGYSGLDDDILLKQEKIVIDSLSKENHIGLEFRNSKPVFKRFDSKVQTVLVLNLEIDTKEFLTKFSDKDCTLRKYVVLCIVQILGNGHFGKSPELSVILKGLYERTLKDVVVKKVVTNNPMKIITI